MLHRYLVVILAGLLTVAAPAFAGEANVTDAKATRTGSGWRFDVTVRHADTGWEHYADAWRVKGKDGTVYGTRTLYHPHVDEQPFTRSLSGVSIPDGTTQVQIQARDTLGGWAEDKVPLTLP